jgi:methylphosphotriester-DNA--protein-cysteine methyltransferase
VADLDEQQQEQQRVTEVIEKIDEQKQHTEDLYHKAHQETSQVERNYSQNAKVNLIEADDAHRNPTLKSNSKKGW